MRCTDHRDRVVIAVAAGRAPTEEVATRIVQGREHVCFLAEPRLPIGVVNKRVGQDLQGDLARQLRILRAISLSYPAFADQIDDAIGTSCPARDS